MISASTVHADLCTHCGFWSELHTVSAPVVAHLMTLMVGLHVFGFDVPFEYAMVLFCGYHCNNTFVCRQVLDGRPLAAPFSRCALLSDLIFVTACFLASVGRMPIATADLSPSSWAAMLGISAPVRRLVSDVRCSSALV